MKYEAYFLCFLNFRVTTTNEIANRAITIIAIPALIKR